MTQWSVRQVRSTNQQQGGIASRNHHERKVTDRVNKRVPPNLDQKGQRHQQLDQVGPADVAGKGLRGVAPPNQYQRAAHDEADGGVDNQNVIH